MIQINIVDILLGYINEYVEIVIRDIDTYKVLSRYNRRVTIDEKYLGKEVKDFVVEKNIVTIWIKES